MFGEKKLLIVQSDYGEKNIDLIACARHRLMDERQRQTIYGVTHVLFIIQLPRVTGGTSFTSFQGGPWTCTHIDQLTCPPGINGVVKHALSLPLNEFFHMLIENDANIPADFKVCGRIKDNVQMAVSRLVSNQTYKQMERMIEILLEEVANEVPLG